MSEQRDYREVFNPRLLTRDVLMWIVENATEVPGGFTSRTVADGLEITVSDACMRIKRLIKWDCIRELGHVARYRRYEVTRWGMRTAERWSQLEMRMAERWSQK